MLGFGRARAAEARVQELEAENRNYTDTITNALLDAATGAASAGYVSGLETAAGQLSRAFAAATISGVGMRAFDPWVMAQIGRQMVEYGEAAWLRRGLRLFPALSYDERPGGGYDLNMPNGVVVQAPADRVFLAQWNIDLTTGRGMGPLDTARQLRTLMSRLEGAMTTELNAAVGYLLPLPSDGTAANVEQLKQDLAELNGRIAVIETARGGWGSPTAGAPAADYRLARMGPAIPDSSVRLFEAARIAIFTACGLPPSLTADQDGTGQREAWRRYLHGTVAPLGRIVATAADRCGLPINVDWDQLFASDIQGRARAFQSLVGGGMDIAEAAAASGLLNPE